MLRCNLAAPAHPQLHDFSIKFSLGGARRHVSKRKLTQCASSPPKACALLSATVCFMASPPGGANGRKSVILHILALKQTNQHRCGESAGSGASFGRDPQTFPTNRLNKIMLWIIFTAILHNYQSKLLYTKQEWTVAFFPVVHVENFSTPCFFFWFMNRVRAKVWREQQKKRVGQPRAKGAIQWIIETVLAGMSQTVFSAGIKRCLMVCSGDVTQEVHSGGRLPQVR